MKDTYLVKAIVEAMLNDLDIYEDVEKESASEGTFYTTSFFSSYDNSETVKDNCKQL